MATIKITVMRERKSFEKAEVEIEVMPGDHVDDVVGAAELAANDLGLWSYHDFGQYPYVSAEDSQRIAEAADVKEEAQP